MCRGYTIAVVLFVDGGVGGECWRCYGRRRRKIRPKHERMKIKAVAGWQLGRELVCMCHMVRLRIKT